MTRMENLSVNDMDGDSTCVGLRCIDSSFRTYQDHSKRYRSFIHETKRTEVDFRVGVKNGKPTLTVIAHSDTPASIQHNAFDLSDIDIDKLIEFLQESKQFVSEELVYQKLAGIK